MSKNHTTIINISLFSLRSLHRLKILSPNNRFVQPDSNWKTNKMLNDKIKVIISTGNILNVNKKAGQKTNEEVSELK